MHKAIAIVVAAAVTLLFAAPSYSQDCTVSFGMITAEVTKKEELPDISKTYHTLANEKVSEVTDSVKLRPGINFGAIIKCDTQHVFNAKWEFPGKDRPRDVYVYKERTAKQWTYGWTIGESAKIEKLDLGKYELTIAVDGKEFFRKTFTAK